MSKDTTMGVTINSDGTDGKRYEITLDKTGHDTGKVDVKTWNDGANHAANAPDKDDTTKLYAVKAMSDGSKIACNADVFGPDPSVTFVIAELPQPSVTVTIKGSLGGLGDGSTTYAVSPADFASIRQFVAGAGFPTLA